MSFSASSSPAMLLFEVPARAVVNKIKIQGGQDCQQAVSKGNKPTNSSSFKNQSGHHLSNFLTTLHLTLSRFTTSLAHPK